MTPPREPDRFDKQAAEIFASGDWRFHERVAAALRASHDAALDEAAQEYGAEDLADVKVYCRHVAQRLRELKSPVAAPAAHKYDCHATHFAPFREDLCTCRAPPSEPVAPALDLLNQRSRFEKCAQLFGEIRGDWTDPRDACREGRKLCMEALADIDAAIAARTSQDGAGEGKT